MRRSIFLFMGILLLLLGCKRQQPESQIVVRLFRNRNGLAAKQLDAAILAISTHGLRTANGEPIVVATVELTSDSSTLARLGKDLRPEILILDSSSDWNATDFGLLAGGSVCPAPLSCVSGIPRWVRGKERGAAEIVLKAIGKQLSQQN